MIKYIKDLCSDSYALLKGMKVTMDNFCRKKVTEQYPENRGKVQRFDRFRGTLVMEHDSNNEHGCTGCGICQMNCPNHTIQVITKQIETEDGKKRKILDKYIYDLGSCTYCALCTQVCPQKAISWSNDFEHANFTRESLVKQLNKEGSKLREKKPIEKPVSKEDTNNNKENINKE